MSIATNISPDPIWKLLDQSGNVLAALNANGSTPSTVAAAGTAYGVAGLVSKIKVLVSSAQLLALKGTPLVNMIPAPGANKFIQVTNLAFRYLFGTVAYTLNAGTIRLFYGPVANAKPLCASVAAGLVDQTSNRIIPGQVLTQPGSLTDAQGLNVDIELANDGAAEMTLGDGTLEVVIGYKIIAIP